jgi:carboxyl-terminal processing protease
MRFIKVLFFVLISINSFGQIKVKAILDTVLMRSKELSMYSSTVNWDSLQQQVYRKAENATKVTDLKPAFEYLINQLRDHHGRVLSAADYSNLSWFTDYKQHRHPDKRKTDMETWKIVNNPDARFTYQLLPGNIGYLNIVGIGPALDIQEESKRIRAAVIELASKKVDKWIIDLRYNGGGNMHPMMAGIAPLIGDGIVGSLVTLQKEKQFDWEIKNGNFIYFGYQAVDLPNKIVFTTPPRIAVLTSRWTVSSGEIVATALKGRPDTRFFGEATGGATTNTCFERIADEVILCISTGIFCDRNGVAYEVNVPVDVEIPFKSSKDPAKDSCVLAASEWLRK